MLWRHDLVKPRELLLPGHFTPSTLTKAKCPDDKTLLHLERSCYGGHFTPWTLTKAKCSHDKTLLRLERSCHGGTHLGPGAEGPRRNALMARLQGPST
jgi:hypothetical protein